MQSFILAHIFLLCLVSSASAGEILTLSTSDAQEDATSQATNLVLTECFHRLGYGLTILVRPSKRSILEANEGRVDGDFSRTEAVTQFYPNLIKVPEHLALETLTAFSPNPYLKIDGWKSLRNYHVAWITGRMICEKHLGDAASTTSVSTPVVLLKFLSEQRAEVGVLGLEKGCATLRQLKITNVHPLLPPLEVVPLYLYLHKRHKALIPKVNDMLHTLKSDGTYAAIHQHFFNDAPYPAGLLSNPHP